VVFEILERGDFLNTDEHKYPQIKTSTHADGEIQFSRKFASFRGSNNELIAQERFAQFARFVVKKQYCQVSVYMYNDLRKPTLLINDPIHSK